MRSSHTLRLAAAAGLVLLLASGCSDLGPLVKPKPQAQLSALALDFGTVAVNQSSIRTLTIQNLGTGPLPVTPSIVGAGYALVSGAPFTVPAGSQWSLDVRFTPNAVGSFPSTLDLGSEAPQVALSGSGADQLPGAHVSVFPTSIDFGQVSKGTSSSVSFQIFSDGIAPLIVNVVANARDVQIVTGGGSATLNPGQSRTVGLQFVPLTGGPLTGSVATGPACPDVPVQGASTTVSWATDVRPILYNNCGCHAFGDPFAGYTYTVNFACYYYPAPNVVVKPYDLNKSVLYQKIINSGVYGPLMPQGGPPLSGHDVGIIRTWILEGAWNN